MTRPCRPFDELLRYLALGNWVPLSRTNAEELAKLHLLATQLAQLHLYGNYTVQHRDVHSAWTAVDAKTHVHKPYMKYRGRINAVAQTK